MLYSCTHIAPVGVKSILFKILSSIFTPKDGVDVEYNINYARQHICYSAYMLSPVRPSVRLTVRRVDHTKTVEVRIMKFSPYSSPIPLVLQVKFHPEILRGYPRAEASNKGGVGKISSFLSLSVNIKSSQVKSSSL